MDYIKKAKSSYGRYYIKFKSQKFLFFWTLKDAQNFLFDFVNIGNNLSLLEVQNGYTKYKAYC